MGNMAEIFSTPGMAVDLYDRLWGERLPGSSVDGDVAFYVQQARKTGGPVLELGVGTGRVALPLARAGFRVTGVDDSAAMLGALRRKLVLSPYANLLRLVRADMRSFAAPGKYALALIPFRAFHHLWTPEDQARSLTCIRKHLKPHGRLVIDLFDPRLDLCLPSYTKAGGTRPDKVTPIHRDRKTGRRWTLRFISRKNDPVRQILKEIWVFEERDRKNRIVKTQTDTVTLRWTYRWEMRHLLEKTGFRVVSEYSDFKRSAPAYGKEQIWIAERD